jgi:type IV pilus assembly protein PilC
MVLSLVGVLRDGAAWWGGALVFGTAALWLRSRRPAGRVQLRRAQLSIPIVGTVLLKSEIVRLCRTLSTMLRNGMPILAALRATARAMTIPVVVDALEGATVRVSQGSSLAAALRAQGVMPDLTLEMIEVGETTGSLDAMLDDVADFHEGELDLLLSQATAWLEPVLLLVMGVMVGGIVIAMYLPIFELAGTL